MPDRTIRADTLATRTQLIAALRRLQAEGKSPTAGELARAAGKSHTNVRHHLPDLEQAGVIAFREVPSKKVRREIVLVEPEEGGSAP